MLQIFGGKDIDGGLDSENNPTYKEVSTIAAIISLITFL